jgi:hypothetical protein
MNLSGNRRAGCVVRDGFQRSDEAITLAREGLDESRVFRRVVQGLTQLLNGFVQTLIKLDESVARPERPLEFLPLD